jgi:hypothetical protein
MPPVVSHPQVQKELALLLGLGRLRRGASLKMFAVRSLRQRVSPIVMPVIEQSDEHPVDEHPVLVQHHRALLSRTRFASGAQG